ncbi:MFS transporter [Iocasia frigidifontis]|uniref:MFS transporter n=1 Tax=Iocasia fonsfrigidae TaxID=2682810 RepID=A0A8A7K6N3_9FIRM|nr:MFS transporter [Iocasia fonsfrigidae]QTL97443.1 MFS transporter [Iocasia fonsfrigidae]
MSKIENKDNNKIKLTILSLSLITVMSGAAVSPALGPIANYFHNAAPLLIKLIITIPSLFIILTSLLFSLIANKFSTKSIAILGLILYIVGGCCAGLVNNIYLLLVFRIILGIGVGLIMPLSTGLISYLFDKNEQSTLMGYSSAMNNIGGVIALAVSGLLVAINWRYSFIVYLLGLLVMVMVIIFLPAVNIKSSRSSLDKSSTLKILPHISAMFIVMLIFYALPANFSIIMTKQRLIPTSLIGVLMSIQNIFAFLAGMILSKIIKKFADKTKYLAIFMLFLGYLILSFTNNVYAIILALLAIGIGFGIIVPLLNLQISLNIVKEKAPAAMALMVSMLYLGQFLSPIILDLIKNIFNLQDIKAPFFIATIISMIFLFCLKKIPVQYTKLEN